MENQGKLIEMLQEMKEIAQSQNNYLTKNEIAKYLTVSPRYFAISFFVS